MTKMGSIAYFTTKEAAEELGVSQSTVARWCREGRFKGAKQVPWLVAYPKMLFQGPDVRHMWAVPQREVLH